MGAPAAGSVALVPFPFSDLSRAKLRPAVVLAAVERGDIMLCQITSNPYADPLALLISDSDFQVGGLQRNSFARPGKVFTASAGLLTGVVGRLMPHKHRELVDALVAVLRQGLIDS